FRTEDVAIDRPFAADLTVIAEAGYHAAERLDAIAQECPPSVVLEADHRRPVPFDHDIAYEALCLSARMDRMQVEDARAAQLFAFSRPVKAAHQLIAATDRQDRDIALNGFLQRLAFDLHEVLCDQPLLRILRTASENEIVFLGLQLITELETFGFKTDTAGLTPALEAEDVAAVAVDVHELRKQVSDAQG